MTQESIAKKALSEWQEELAEKDKQIADLEKACDETQELLDKQIEVTCKLDQENAELKEINEKLRYDFGEGYIQDEKEFWEKTSYLEEQLTKAKEIIKTFLGFAEAFGYSPSMDKFIMEAEQFLSEVKK